MIYNNVKDIVSAFDTSLFKHQTSFMISYRSTIDFDPTKILTYSSFYDDCIANDGFNASTSNGIKTLRFSMTYNTPGTTADSEKSTYAEGFNVAADEMEEVRGTVGGELPIDSRTSSFPVSDSEQLYYAVTQGYKPECTGGAKTVYDKARTICSEIISSSFSGYDKVSAIYDWIGEHVQYDEDGLAKASEANTAGSTYKNADNSYLEGVFNRGLAVCDGYSKAFALLCGMAGLECYRVVGDKPSTNDPTVSIGHAWNYVKIDDKWFASDPTANNVAFSVSIAGGLDKRFELGNHDLMLTSKANLEELGYSQRSLIYPETSNASSYYYSEASISKDAKVVLTINDEASFTTLFDIFDKKTSTSTKYLEYLDPNNIVNGLYAKAIASKTDYSQYGISQTYHAMFYCK